MRRRQQAQKPACGRDHSPAQASPAKRTGCGAPPLRPCGLSPAPRRRPRCTAPIPRAPSHTAEDTCSALCVVSHDSTSRRNTQKQEKSAPSFIPPISFHPSHEAVEPSKTSGTSGIRSKNSSLPLRRRGVSSYLSASLRARIGRTKPAACGSLSVPAVSRPRGRTPPPCQGRSARR